MLSDRAVKLFIVAVVLATAWYAGAQAAPGLAVPVAIVGLGAARARAVLGIPAAAGMVALAVYAPGVAIAAAVIVGLLAIIALFVKSALRHGSVLGETLSADASHTGFVGMAGGGSGDFGGGDCDVGV